MTRHCIAVVLLLAAAVAAWSVVRTPEVAFEKHTLDLGSNETCAVADINRDGKLDIVSGENWYEAPRWTKHHFRDISYSENYIDNFSDLPADVNGDGAPDVFENNLGCCGRDHVQAEVLLNDGTGRFTAEADGIRGMITDVYGNDHSFACLFADVNGDGSPDLVLGGGEEIGANSSQVLLNDGHGHFTFSATLPPTIGPPNNAFVIDMKAADVNGDGAVDLVFAESLNDPWYIGTNLQVLIGDGHGHFTDDTTARLPQPPSQAKSWPDRVLLDDINDDGRPDLTVQFAPEGQVTEVDPTIVYVNENGVFRRIAAPADGFGREGGGVGWVNGDGPHALFSVEFRPLEEGLSRYYVTPELVTPGPPSNLRATRVGRTVHLRWSRVTGATSYRIRRNGTAIGTTIVASYLDRKPGKRPSYTVRSVNASGVSSDSLRARP
jgi:hypothetical protein